jgi:hypothetical protein
VENDELFARAAFGQQVDQFWLSQIGNYLQTRAREEYTAALESLKSCDPTDARLVMKLQGDIWRTEAFEKWLSEAILDGIKALDLVENSDGEN